MEQIICAYKEGCGQGFITKNGTCNNCGIFINIHDGRRNSTIKEISDRMIKAIKTQMERDNILLQYTRSNFKPDLSHKILGIKTKNYYILASETLKVLLFLTARTIYRTYHKNLSDYIFETIIDTIRHDYYNEINNIPTRDGSDGYFLEYSNCFAKTFVEPDVYFTDWLESLDNTFDKIGNIFIEKIKTSGIDHAGSLMVCDGISFINGAEEWRPGHDNTKASSLFASFYGLELRTIIRTNIVAF